MCNNRLRELRKNKNLSLRELAEKINIHYATLMSLENGRMRLSDKYIFDICSYFNVSADYLLGLSDIEKKQDNNMYLDYYDVDFKKLGKLPALTESVANPDKFFYVRLSFSLGVFGLDYQLVVLFGVNTNIKTGMTTLTPEQQETVIEDAMKSEILSSSISSLFKTMLDKADVKNNKNYKVFAEKFFNEIEFTENDVDMLAQLVVMNDKVLKL